jgi:hypothetical protein
MVGGRSRETGMPELRCCLLDEEVGNAELGEVTVERDAMASCGERQGGGFQAV